MDSRRLAYLKALEIDVWERRDGSARAPVAVLPQPVIPQVETPPPEAVVTAPVRVVPVPAPIEADAGEIGKLGWDELATAVRSCTKCPLHATRTNGVFGVGDP